MTIDSHEMRHSYYARSRYFIEGEDIHTYVYIRINYIYLYFADVVQCFYFARSSGITFQICGSFIQGVTAFVAFTEIAMISAPANINLWIFMTCYIYHSDVFFLPISYIHVWVEWPWRHCCETSWPLSAIEQSFKWHYTQIKVNSKPGTLWKILCNTLLVGGSMYFH